MVPGGRLDIRWDEGQIEITVRCSRRVFITALAVATALLGGPNLLAALQQVLATAN
jgi:hypothetical protein